MEKQDVKRQAWVQVDRVGAAAPRSLKAAKLVEGNQYHFRVTAENDIGASDPTQTEQPVTAKLPFGKLVKGSFTWSQRESAIALYVCI